MLRLTISSILLALISHVAPAAELSPPPPDPRTVVRFGPAYKYPQDGWTVLHIEGEPYDRGYQHGHLMAKELEGYLKSLSAQQSATAPADGWNLTRTLVSATFLRKIGAEYLEEMKGTADGAAAQGATIHGRPIDLLDIVCANVSAEYDTLESALHAVPTGLEGKTWPKRSAPKAMPKPAPEHCSAFVATGPATKDGKIVMGHITMWTLYSTNFYNVWLDVKPAKGHRVMMQSFPGGIWSAMDYYLASSGMMMTETTIRQTRFNPDGIPLADRVRRAMQYGNSIDDVVKTLVEKNNGLYANEWLIGDANTDEIAVLELGTSAHRLRRSSKKEWIPGGMPGFYWGCNNTKDLKVRLDTYASLDDRPRDVSWRPSDRDQSWLTLLKDHHGTVDVNFGKLAFTTPPLAAHSSLDAKVTSSALVKELKSVALFGPPLGHAWRPTFDQRTKYADIRTLVSNDWTTLTGKAPPASDLNGTAVDLGGKGDKAEATVEADGDDDEGGTPNTTAAWNGTLLPKSDADLWLTAAFAQYERIVALETALKDKGNGKLTKTARDQLDLMLFRYRTDYRSAMATKPEVEPKSPTEIEIDRVRWHKQTVAYGVLTLAALRSFVGEGPFLDVMVSYGRRNAGREVTVGDFVSFVGRATNKDVVKFFRDWEAKADSLASDGATFHVHSFFEDLPHTLIVYGTTQDVAANKEAAGELQRLIRERWSNVTLPVVADRDLADDVRRNRHLLLVGRPASNLTAKRLETAFPKVFGRASFVANGTTYGHPGSVMLLAGVNPENRRFSYVVLAGNGADATWHGPEKWMTAPVADLVVFPAAGGAKGMIRK